MFERSVLSSQSLSNSNTTTTTTVVILSLLFEYLRGNNCSGSVTGRHHWLRSCGPPAAKVYIEEPLQHFIGHECETKLGRTSEHSSWSAFPEGGKALLFVDLFDGIYNSIISGLASSSGNLKTGLDNVSGCH